MDSEFNIRRKIKNVCDAGHIVKLLFTAFVIISFFALLFGNGVYTDVQFGQNTSFIVLGVVYMLVFFALATLEVFCSKHRIVEWLMLAFSVLFSTLLLVNGKVKLYIMFMPPQQSCWQFW